MGSLALAGRSPHRGGLVSASSEGQPSSAGENTMEVSWEDTRSSQESAVCGIPAVSAESQGGHKESGVPAPRSSWLEAG